jgi:Tol biopolymer transport system component
MPQDRTMQNLGFAPARYRGPRRATSKTTSLLTLVLVAVASLVVAAGVTATRGSGATPCPLGDDRPPADAPPRKALGPGPTPDLGVWVVGVDGSDPGRVPAPLDLGPYHQADVAWSPDWSRLAYVNSLGDVVVVDPEGKGQTTVVHDAPEPGQFVGDVLGELHLSDLAWSPDGRHIAGVYNGHELVRDVGGLAVVDVETSELRRLTSTRPNGSTRSPQWAPDSTRIVISADSLPVSSTYRLETVSVDGSDHHVIVDTSGLRDRRARGGGVTAAAWSPDGALVVFGAGGGYYDTRIEVIRADGTGQRRIVDGCLAWDFAWSPDGTRIAFSDYSIVVMNRDGTDMTRVPNTWWGSMPTWSPDGQRLAFLRQ